GVRPLGRGGAFIAGADDLHATWLNPAGLADAGSSAMPDLTMDIYSADFARTTDVVDASGAVRPITFPTVTAHGTPIPIPLIGGCYAVRENKEVNSARSRDRA